MTQEELKSIIVYFPKSGKFACTLTGKPLGSHQHGYNTISVRGKRYRAARLAFFYMTGRWPIPTVDYKNRVSNDDRWTNLREATYIEQANNKRRKGNQEWVRGDGVYYRSDRKNCWRARTWAWIGNRRVRVSLGNYPTESMAIAAYNKYRNNS